MASKRHGDNLAEAARKKRLGQYFSGIRLSRGLASIASARDARTVIDPMGGVGDMIAAALYAGGAPKEAVTIEIDPAAHNIARESFSNVSSNTVTSVLGNCFDKRIIKGLPQKDYDLVITNPPYVRYQSLSKAHTSDISVPSAVEIRNTLIDVVRYFPHLDSKDKELISTLISSYSGLSDLAVPSWFLCAMLTRIGGTLAMVVPESWLTRDYAQIVQYLLFRWFRIRYVVEDSQAVWFSDALVKTTLLVAERIESKDSILDWNEEGYLHVKIDGRAMNMGSIVGNQFPDSANPDESLAELLTQISKRKTGLKNGYIDANWIGIKNSVLNIHSCVKDERWYAEVERDSPRRKIAFRRDATIPGVMAQWLGEERKCEITSLEMMSVKVSQGLRTGANKFFYVDLIQEGARTSQVKPNPIFGIEKIAIPSDSLVPVLRKQAELNEGYRLDIHSLKGRVLALQRYVLPEELDTNGNKKRSSLQKEMPSELAHLVRLAQKTNIGTESNVRLIPELSAVRTNVKKGHVNDAAGAKGRWYMLPPFSKRHTPDVFVPRINNGYPKARLNSEEGALIDANFSTLWIGNDGEIDKFALLAILNSTWCLLSMALIASIMGGGALKLEATHLRKLPIPVFNKRELSALAELGSNLVNEVSNVATIRKIDTLLVASLVGKKAAPEKYDQLLKLKVAILKERQKGK